MTGVFWLGMFLLSVAAGLVSLAYLILLTRKKKPTDGAKNLACTFLLLLVISSVGVTAHANDEDGAWENEVIGHDSQAELVDFEQMYHEFQSNELRADEHYQGKRYLVAATIMGFDSGDPLATDSDIHLTMQVELGGSSIPLYCGFSSEHRELLMEYNVGDVVIFEGTCQKAWEWTDCEMR